MSAASKPISFDATLGKLSDDFGWHYLPVSREVNDAFGFKGNSRRVVGTLNGRVSYQCALMPKDGGYFIIVNKKVRDQLGLHLGDTVRVELARDESKYGLPMPEELREVLNQDPEGDRLFHALTAGKQRSILYYVGKDNDVDRRIQTSLIFIEHLKNNGGKIIPDRLTRELKRPLL